MRCESMVEAFGSGVVAASGNAAAFIVRRRTFVVVAPFRVRPFSASKEKIAEEAIQGFVPAALSSANRSLDGDGGIGGDEGDFSTVPVGGVRRAAVSRESIGGVIYGVRAGGGRFVPPVIPPPAPHDKRCVSVRGRSDKSRICRASVTGTLSSASPCRTKIGSVSRFPARSSVSWIFARSRQDTFDVVPASRPSRAGFAPVPPA